MNHRQQSWLAEASGHLTRAAYILDQLAEQEREYTKSAAHHVLNSARGLVQSANDALGPLLDGKPPP